MMDDQEELRPEVQSPGTEDTAIVGQDLVAGQVIDSFVIEYLAGVGGMSKVWCASQTEMDRVVAIKVLLKTQERDLQRFLREARSYSKLQHDNIVQIYSFGQLPDTRPYLAMEFLDGEGLLEALKSGRVKKRDLPGVFAQILSALGLAHENGVVHRDLKPSNIMILPGGKVKLVDFGIASVIGGGRDQSLTGTDEILGTPAYMSPEQCSGGDIDGRSDLYSLGCIIYECLIGRRPFQAESPMELLSMHLREPVVFSPAVPRIWQEFLRTAMQKDRADRFQTAQQMSAALSAIPVPFELFEGNRRAKFLVAAMFVILVLNVVPAVWIYIKAVDDKQAQENLALASRISAEGHATRAGKAFEAYRYELALKEAEEAVLTDPRVWSGWFQRSLCNARGGRYKQAREDLDKAIELAPPSNGQALFQRAQMRLANSEFKGALADIDRLASQKNLDKYIIARLRADILVGLGRFEEAEEEATRSIKSHGTGDAFRIRGLARAGQKRYDEALDDMASSIFFREKHSASRAGQRDEFNCFLELSGAYKARAYVYEQMGDQKRAAEDLRMAQEALAESKRLEQRTMQLAH